MKKSNYYSLIAAYYLSKFDKQAYESLGVGNSSETHRTIAKILGSNANTIKNMRDEFDPFHENKRAGWYQRELRPSRKRVIELYQHLEEEELRDLIVGLLERDKTIEDKISKDISEGESENSDSPIFIIRGITGRMAEEIYTEFHSKNGLPKKGKLIDKRDHGCGYDFEITGDKTIYVEVKGLDADSGGISFTSKEWDMAKKYKDDYFLVVVKNVSSSPNISIIQNPFKTLKPKKYVFSTIQIRWNLAII